MSILDLCYEKYKINKPIRLIELFAGIGSQCQALKNINANFEHWKVVEIDKYAIKSYNAIHNTNFETSDITKITAKDLQIIDVDKFEYIMTYSFPCFTKESLVLTKEGYKKIIDIKIGDFVLTHNNIYKRVVNVFDNGLHDVYSLKAMSIDEIKTTFNHKFYTRIMNKEWNNQERRYIRKFEKPKWEMLCNLTKNHYLGIAINQNSIIPEWKGIDFKYKDGRKTRHKNQLSQYMNNKDFWYMIGRYIADGWIRQQGGIVICSGKHKIQKLIDKILFNNTIIEERTVYKIHISLKELSLFVEQFGKGAKNKRLTNTIIDLPIELLESFLNGYFDGDGYFAKGVQKATSISKELIYGIAQCVAKVYKSPYSIWKTIKNPNTIIENRIVNQNDYYNISFKKEKKKQDKAFYENGYIWFPIRKIEKLDKEKVYDIEVEDDHSFTVQNTIVHNCQDLSLAGKQKGMAKGDKTRSGLLWEIERILKECDNLPQVLLMENVPQVHGEKNLKDFLEWISFLESLGYISYWQDLNSKDYGIPQNRNRTFMVSILGDYYYEFPKKKKLTTFLADMLEKEVDEKYFLSQTHLEYILDTKDVALNNNRDINNCVINPNIAKTISCRGAKDQRADVTNFVIEDMKSGNIINEMSVKEMKLLIKEATKKGYAEATEGDGVYIDRPHQKRGVVQKRMIQTLKTSPDVGVVVRDEKNDRLLRIRKLTPKECWRLMGFSSASYNKVEKVNSDSQLYKQAGNSIVVNVLEEIFKKLL